MRIGHDGSGVGSGWFLDKVDIEIPVRGETYVFSANRWLDVNEMDGKIEIDLYPTEVKETEASKNSNLVQQFKEKTERSNGSLFFAEVPFEVTVKTSDMDKCGTDSNAYLVIYGSNGLKTSAFCMENRSGEFEPGVTSRFTVKTY